MSPRDPRLSAREAPDRRWRIVALYETLLGAIDRADDRIRVRDLEGKAAALEEGVGAVFELMAILETTEEADLASRLSALYGFFAAELMEIGRTMDLGRLAGVREIVGDLHESWVAAAGMMHAPPADSSPEGVPPIPMEQTSTSAREER